MEGVASLGNPPLDVLGGTKEQTETNRYLARNGLFYNGYFGSADCAEDAFGSAIEKIKNALEAELNADKPSMQS